MTLRYFFDARTMPLEYDAPQIAVLIGRCCAEWSKKVGSELLRFEQVFESARAQIVFEFAPHPLWPEKLARHVSRNGQSVIAFDPRAAWEISWRQRMFGRVEGQSFICLCLHEIGHALGCYDHSPDPSSIMYKTPTRKSVERGVAAFVRARLEGGTR